MLTGAGLALQLGGITPYPDRVGASVPGFKRAYRS
jgi:hypothetical protein